MTGEADLAVPRPEGSIPDAVILDTDFGLLGTLTTPLGGGHPGHPVLEFSDWRNGIPWRIDAHQYNAAALGDYDEHPAIWNPVEHRYLIDETQ